MDVYTLETYRRFYILVMNNTPKYVETTVKFSNPTNFMVVSTNQDDIIDDLYEFDEYENEIIIGLEAGGYAVRYLEVLDKEAYANPGEYTLDFAY